jgi:lysyl-tRNA synthetase class 1
MTRTATETTLPVTGGAVKLQWKPDFVHALGGTRTSISRCSARTTGPTQPSTTASATSLGGRAPEHFVYELFLDENGQKISKSKGNGLTIDEWLTYAPTESLGPLHVPEATGGEEAAIST